MLNVNHRAELDILKDARKRRRNVHTRKTAKRRRFVKEKDDRVDDDDDGDENDVKPRSMTIKMRKMKMGLVEGRKIQIRGWMTKTRVLSRKWDLVWMKMMKMTFILCFRPEQLLALDAWPDLGLI